MKIITGIVLLVLLILLNPSIDQHREALGEVFDRRWNEDIGKDDEDRSWLFDAFLFVAGDSLKSSVRTTVLDHVYRKNFAIFSVGCIKGEVATIGALGFVYVWASED